MFYILAFFAGMALALQAPINASLARDLGGIPIFAGFVSFLIGTICLIFLLKIFHQVHEDTLKLLLHQEWWKFLGGILGAFVVFTTIIAAPKIGLAPMVVFLLVGQLLMGLTLDFFGAFHLVQQTISWYKIIGIGVICFGILIFFYQEIF